MFALEARPLVPSFPFVLFDHPTGMGSLWGAQKSTYRMSFCALSESVIPSLVARLSAPVRPAPQMGVRDLLLSLCPLGARGPEIAKPNPSRMCTYTKMGGGAQIIVTLPRASSLSPTKLRGGVRRPPARVVRLACHHEAATGQTICSSPKEGGRGICGCLPSG